MSFEDDILIERYIKGLLTKDEQKSFFERLNSDLNFKKKVALETEFFNVLDLDNWNFVEQNSSEANGYKQLLVQDDLQNLKKTLKQVNEELNANTQKKRRIRRLYYYVAASVIVLLGLQLFFYQTNSNQNLYNEYVNLDDLPSFVSRNDTSSQLVKAQEFFEYKNYSKALELFNSYSREYSIEMGNIYIYQALSYVELGDYKNAESKFDSLINSTFLDAEKGYWYKALLYIKMDKVNKAKHLLNDIVSGSLFNYKKAEQLLEDLD